MLIGMFLPIDLKLLKDGNVSYSIVEYVPGVNPNYAVGVKKYFLE